LPPCPATSLRACAASISSAIGDTTAIEADFVETRGLNLSRIRTGFRPATTSSIYRHLAARLRRVDLVGHAQLQRFDASPTIEAKIPESGRR
jgi:hypothetical protein